MINITISVVTKITKGQKMKRNVIMFMPDLSLQAQPTHTLQQR